MFVSLEKKAGARQGCDAGDGNKIYKTTAARLLSDGCSDLCCLLRAVHCFFLSSLLFRQPD